MIKSVSHDSVSRLVADSSMCFATTLDKAFENIDCMSAILRCQAKNRFYESTQRLIQGGSKTHRAVGDKARDAVVAGTLDHAAWNDQPLAAGGLCGKRGADGLGAATVLPVLPVRADRRHAGSTCGGRPVAAWRQAVGSGDRSDELGFWQDHDQHPDDFD